MTRWLHISFTLALIAAFGAVGPQTALAQPPCGLERLSEMPDDRRIALTTLEDDDQYIAGDWDGDGVDEIGVRSGNDFYVDLDGDNIADLYNRYGHGESEGQYLAEDWNGDGCSDLAVRRGPNVIQNHNFDAIGNETVIALVWKQGCQLTAGTSSAETEDPSLIVLCDGAISFDSDGDGKATGADTPSFKYGRGCRELEYVVGDFGGTGVVSVGVRREDGWYLNFDHDPFHDVLVPFLHEEADEYFVGDWNGDGSDTLAGRMGNRFFFDYDHDGLVDDERVIGSGNYEFPGCGTCGIPGAGGYDWDQ